LRKGPRRKKTVKKGQRSGGEKEFGVFLIAQKEVIETKEKKKRAKGVP